LWRAYGVADDVGNGGYFALPTQPIAQVMIEVGAVLAQGFADGGEGIVAPLTFVASGAIADLIPTALIFDLCPFACSDGSDNVRAAHQRIPCVGACVDDGLVCVPHLMSEEICTQIFPDVFG
jgi:hypothetical protein